MTGLPPSLLADLVDAAASAELAHYASGGAPSDDDRIVAIVRAVAARAHEAAVLAERARCARVVRWLDEQTGNVGVDSAWIRLAARWEAGDSHPAHWTPDDEHWSPFDPTT